MKKISLVICLITVFLSGCVSSRDYKLVQKENEELKDQVSSLNATLESAASQFADMSSNKADMSSTIAAMSSTIYEYEHGAANLLTSVKKSYDSKDYSAAIEYANELHEKFSDSDEDTEAQNISALCQTELDKIDAEANKSKEEKLRDIIRVKKIYTSDPNSADGVDLHIEWVNNSEKIIKYIYFEARPFNAVSDYVNGEYNDSIYFWGKSTGPYNTGEGMGPYFYWENAWYNSSIVGADLFKIDIEYMDGTETSIGEDDIQYIIY